MDDLPYEILLEIFENLDNVDILSCSAVCKLWGQLTYSECQKYIGFYEKNMIDTIKIKNYLWSPLPDKFIDKTIVLSPFRQKEINFEKCVFEPCAKNTVINCKILLEKCSGTIQNCAIYGGLGIKFCEGLKIINCQIDDEYIDNMIIGVGTNKYGVYHDPLGAQGIHIYLVGPIERPAGYEDVGWVGPKGPVEGGGPRGPIENPNYVVYPKIKYPKIRKTHKDPRNKGRSWR